MTRLRSIADWQAALRGGADPAPLLRERLASLHAAGASPVWIRLATEVELEAQLDRLAALAARRGDLPLYGLPFAAKDNIDIAGVPTTAACPAFAYLPTRHANAVQRLVDAGAVWLGKTNLDQFATGLVGTRSPFGRPASVADASRISGGSSSGSAVAVARGEIAFALGTDTAGSGRIPAGFNGLVGVKPTLSRVGTSGVVPACRSLDCVSVFAHDVRGAAQVLASIEGSDAADAYSAFAPGPASLPARPRIGVPREPQFFGDAGYARAWSAALARLDSLGASIVPLDFGPLHETAELLYGGPWVAERHAVVERLLAADPQAFDPVVRRVIEAARGFSATDTFRAMYRLQAYRQRHGRLWNEVDALMVPTAPGHPHFAEVDADPLAVNASLGRYTNFVNLLGWSALALPAGCADHGLPFGITLIGQAHHDVALLRFGLAWQGDAADASMPHGPAVEASLPIAVVGAHLSGLPLNHQIVALGARLREATTTAPHYRLHALPGSMPPKPGMQRVAGGGHAIAVEVWDVPQHAIGAFLAGVKAPLGLGSVELADGSRVHGFLCEAHALADAPDISAFGGWRAYLDAGSRR